MQHLAWRKSSFSGPDGHCVEVAKIPAAWRKSSYSSASKDCVEVADLSGGAAVRDSKDPAGPVLTFPPAAWAVFTRGVRAGVFS